MVKRSRLAKRLLFRTTRRNQGLNRRSWDRNPLHVRPKQLHSLFRQVARVKPSSNSRITDLCLNSGPDSTLRIRRVRLIPRLNWIEVPSPSSIFGIGTANPSVRLTQEHTFHFAVCQSERIQNIFLNSEIDYRRSYPAGILHRNETF